MIYRLTGATVRAVCVAILVMLPAFLLIGTSQSAVEFTRIFATIMAVLVLYEYGFKTPTVIEFRFAAPYNRIRFLLLLALVVAPIYLISGLLGGQALNSIVAMVARDGFTLMNFSYSPVSIVAGTLSGNDIAMYEPIGQAIALNVFIGLSCVLAYCTAVFTNLWRFGGDDFNMWLNMPTYKSYEASSLQKRLVHSAIASLFIASLIPLFGPPTADLALVLFATDGVLAPIAITWMITIWIYLPMIYLMRAAALIKVAMNRNKKEQWITV